MESLVT